jgi:hypothetical protein
MNEKSRGYIDIVGLFDRKNVNSKIGHQLLDKKGSCQVTDKKR